MVRDFRPEDEAALRRIHAGQGIDYAFPRLDSALFAVKKVREVDGAVTGALLLRITAEAYLLVGGGPREKMAAMSELQPEVLEQAWRMGLDDVVCVVPDSLLGRFRKRLRQLGWAKDRDGWTLFTRKTGKR